MVRMKKHRAQKRRYYRWQLMTEVRYRVHLVRTWLAEQLDDLKDIIYELKNK